MNWKMVKKPETETGDGFFAPSFGFLIQQRPFAPLLLFVCFFAFAFTSCFYLSLLSTLPNQRRSLMSSIKSTPQVSFPVLKKTLPITTKWKPSFPTLP